MKKIFCMVLVILTVAVLTVPSFAAEVIGANSAKIAVTIKGISAEKPVIDGTVGEFEYEEIKYTEADCRYYSSSKDAFVDTIKKYTYKMYASYDAEYIYLAVIVDTPNYTQTKDAGSIWQEYSLQVSCAKPDEATPANRSEYGFAKMSTDGKLVFNAWADAYNFKWAPDLTGKDFNVYTKNDVTTYEMRIPAGAFGIKAFNKGEKIRLNFCMNVGSDTVGDKERGQIEWSQGCGGSKDATKFAVLTLGDSIVIPVVETTAAAKPAAAKPAAGAAAQTADVLGYAAAAVIASAAAGFAALKSRKA
ncbi:MAG: hypothetical protein GX628_10335 [Clostridiales bacterium]|nr:hypothetical protein [Clostridiales bacterium]